MNEGHRDNTVKLSEVSDSAMHWTPQEALEHVLSEFDDPDCETDGILIIQVGKHKGGMVTSRTAAKLSFSEIIAALELTKKREMEES